MLSNSVMGLVALGVLWLNTLLISLDGLLWWKKIRDRLQYFGGLARSGSLSVTKVRSSDDVALTLFVKQLGRFRAADQTVVFRDVAYSVHVGADAEAELDGKPQKLPPTTAFWDWSGKLNQEAPAVTAGALTESKTNRGYTRHVSHRLAQQSVWLAVDTASERPFEWTHLVTTADPRVALKKRGQKVLFLCVVVISVSTLVTALGLSQPLFEGVSLVGGVAGLIWFLGMQPLTGTLRRLAQVPMETMPFDQQEDSSVIAPVLN